MTARTSSRWLRISLLPAVALLGLIYGALSTAPGSSLPGGQLLSRTATRLREAVRNPDRLREGDARDGRWNKSPETSADGRAALEKLEAIGYASGTELAAEASSIVPVNRYGEEHDALNLYVSAHGPEARLVDMQGALVHSWSMSFEEALGGAPRPNDEARLQQTFWRKASLLANGDLIAIYEGHGMVKLDRDSKLLWAHANNAHHDLFVHEDGRVFVLTRVARVRPDLNPNRPLLEEYVVILSPDGEELSRHSILDAVLNSEYDGIYRSSKLVGDMLHTNTLTWLDGTLAERSPAFRRGNLMISFAHTNTVAVLDLEQERLVWAISDLTHSQHDPTVTDDGRILLLDNRGTWDWSRVFEFDPLTHQIGWAYRGNEENGFYTATCGTAQRLTNGNTLITESNAGRAFEVDPAGTIVWEFLSPHRAGDGGELVATLFELRRVERAKVSSWLPR